MNFNYTTVCAIEIPWLVDLEALLGLISVLDGLSTRTCIFTSLGDDKGVSFLKYYVPVCPSGRKEVVEVSCDYRTSYFSDEVGGAGGYMDETYTPY